MILLPSERKKSESNFELNIFGGKGSRGAENAQTRKPWLAGDKRMVFVMKSFFWQR